MKRIYVKKATMESDLISQASDLIKKAKSFSICFNFKKLNDDYIFDFDSNQLFKKDELIQLTRLETNFLALILSNGTEITDYQEIKNIAWKGKEMSIFTMRNIVNKIRQKTYYDIVKNISNKGYRA